MTGINAYHDSLTGNDDEDTAPSTKGLTGSEPTQKLETLKLANRFIYPTAEGNRYEDNDENMNIIISDLNFYLSGSGEDRINCWLSLCARSRSALHLPACASITCKAALSDSGMTLIWIRLLRFPGMPYVVIILAKSTSAQNNCFGSRTEGAYGRFY